MRCFAALLATVAFLGACGDDSEPGTSRAGFVEWATEQGGLEEAEAECVADKLLPRLTQRELLALVSIEQDSSEADVDAAPADEFVEATLGCA